MFPLFPTPSGVELQGELVVMPLDYWLAITRYVIDVEACIELLEVE